VEAENTLSVPNRDCSNGNPFDFGTVGIVNINYFDAQLQSIISKNNQITPASFAIALTYNSYLSDNSGLFRMLYRWISQRFWNFDRASNLRPLYVHSGVGPVLAGRVRSLS